VLVIFSMDTCPYCKQLFRAASTPISPALLRRLPVVVADSKAASGVVRRFGVQSFPTLVLVYPDDRILRFEGQRRADAILDWVKGALE
jgi:thioredoxin-like negative regulator of GroEL